MNHGASPVTDFSKNGFAFPIDVLPKDEASTLRKKFYGIYLQDKNLLGHNCHLLFPELYDLIFNEKILDAVEQVTGPDIMLWASSFFIKKPTSSDFVSWHQDQTYWGFEPDDVVTAWLALSASNALSGCMKVIRGSHLEGQLEHCPTNDPQNMLSVGQTIQADFSQLDPVEIILEPGQMSLHHIGIVHSSAPNSSTQERVGFVMRYIPTRIKQNHPKPYATLVRGEDHFNYFKQPVRPRFDYGETELFNWKQTL
ncbi:MAG: hypothetical protein RL242_2947 [Pseudomonadota bacterium]